MTTICKKILTTKDEKMFAIVTKKIDGEMFFRIKINNKNGKQLEYITFEINEKISLKVILDIINYIKFDLSYRDEIKKDQLNYKDFPVSKSVDHIKETSNSYNIKKINNGDISRFKNLKIWNDDFSIFKMEELEDLITAEDLKEIKESFESFRLNEKKKNTLIRSSIRWCLRGLDARLSAKKVIDEYKKGVEISKVLRKKRRR